MQYWIYILIALYATIVGAISGLGGGIIMKPAFDFIGGFSAPQIATLTAAMTLAMALVSLLTSLDKIKEEKKNLPVLLFVALGSLAGGYLGDYLFRLLTASAPDRLVKVVQNTILIIMVIFVILYMRKGEDRKTFQGKGAPLALGVGLLLGMIASFLGIGGGPVNVAVITLVFGFPVKLSVLCSLSSIFFSSVTKNLAILAKDGLSAYCIEVLPYVVLAAVLGALIGRFIGRKCSEETTNRLFLFVQYMVLCICIVNIIKNLV